jgi:ferredoxin
MATVTVLNRESAHYEVRDGASVLTAMRTNNAPWRSFCGGQALCGTCCMLVVSGNVAEPTQTEKYFIEGWGYHPSYRLACQTRAMSGEVAVVSCMDENYDPQNSVAAYERGCQAAGVTSQTKTDAK